ncbi:hypothetical protein ES703_74172 [subsurface metagenome]
MLCNQLYLSLLMVCRKFFSVATGILGISSTFDFNEGASKALDLVLNRRADIEGFNSSSETVCRGNCL